ncbi:MAG TPA: deoxyribose-phosphate aldolase [Sedimentisphaerales bacterium]|nr:deoxyribose-phosphate aldolase [Sedimentisphaerales bacterium]
MAAIRNYHDLAATIDHTLLSATAAREDIVRLCEEAKEWGFASVCVNPRWVQSAADMLEGSSVKVCSVISFPFGAETTDTKSGAAENAIFDGAAEIDMVADLAAIQAGDKAYFSNEVMEVLAVCRLMQPAATLKVIIEAAALSDDQKIFACRVCAGAGADFIKTSTGFHPAGGAKIEDVKLMKRDGGACRIKASGGIRTAQDALAMLAAGADRLGCSASVAIMRQFREMARQP